MEWYEESFGKDYLWLYEHRDGQEAALQVAFVSKYVSREKEGERMLDLACGSGRHLDSFQRAGWQGVGVDLSPELLAQAKEKNANRLIRADMRYLPFKERSFSLVSSFFTSFGYFASELEHKQVLLECSRVLCKEGSLFLDLPNRETVISDLVPESVSKKGAIEVTQKRSMSKDGKRVEKIISLVDEKSGKEKCYEESVRLFSLEDLSALLKGSGFSIENTFGDFEGNAFLSGSPRMLVFARSSAQ